MKLKNNPLLLSRLVLFCVLISVHLLFFSCDTPEEIASPTNTTPPTPTITLSEPADENTDVALDGTLTFKWDSTNFPESTTYEVYLDTTATPTTKITPDALTDKTFAYSYNAISKNALAYNTIYYWMVKASYIDSTNTTKTITSSVRFFKTITPSLALISPTDAISNVEVEKDIEFVWTTTGFPAKTIYEVYFDTANPPTTKITDTNDPNYTYDASSNNTLSYNTTYYWMVKAVYADSTNSNQNVQSKIRALTTINGPEITLNASTDANTIDIDGSQAFSWETINFPTDATVTYKILFDTNNPPTTEITTDPVLTKNFVYTYGFSTTNNPLEYNTAYYWRVIGTYTNSVKETKTIHSTISSLNTVTANIPLKAHDTNTEISTEGSLTFAWEETAFATLERPVNYNVFFGTTNPPTTKITTDGLTTESFTYNYNASANNTLAYNTTYYWMVKGTYSKDGSNKIKGSSVSSLKTETGFATHVYLTQSRGSSPVAGATVVMQKADGTEIMANENSDASIGKFEFYTDKSYTGTYTLKASKTGHATSTAVFTTPSDSTFAEPLVVSMLLFPPVYASRDTTTPPTISVTGVTANQSISSASSITILSTVETTKNSLITSGGRAVLSLSVGNVGSSFYTPGLSLDSSKTNTTTTKNYRFTLQPIGLYKGVRLLEFVAYDNNNNQSILIIPITINYATYKSIYLDTPATSTSSIVLLLATTVGENNNTYNVSDNASVNVSVLLDSGNTSFTATEPDGMLIYRGKGDEEPKYIGSTMIRTKLFSTSSVEYLVFYDNLPTLSDDAIYTYQLKSYYYGMSQNETYYSDLSKKIKVPIFSKYELSLITPTNNKTYDTVPNTLDFSWKANYSKSIFSSLTSSYLSRTDTLYLKEVLTSNTISSIDITPNIDHSDSINEIYSHSLNTKSLITALQGNHLYWTVTSTLNYKKDKASTEYYYVSSLSLPTISASSAGLPNNAQNGVFFITFK